mmetsp:Transcript_3162/g.6974  ORF Transcript_3162/g.6974 Transcript_3162/m.6974 type:complete len:149 (-) Transcript_3162:300-746(-)
MSEPLLTYLMPIYALASWYGFLTQNTGEYVLPVALVGWIWAAFNIYRTKRVDLGVVTFFFVLIASLCEQRYGFTRGVKLALCVSSVLVAGNYSLVIAFWQQIEKHLAKKKSVLWLNIFRCYCVSGMLFWVCVAAKSYVRGGAGFAGMK